jgi:hypothetical protein
MSPVEQDLPVPVTQDGVDDVDRDEAVARLRELFGSGDLSHEDLSELLDRVFDAPTCTDLAAAMSVLPPAVRLTPASRRLTEPLVLRAPDGGLRLGPGWQLAADTTVSTGVGSARLDLTTASWDAMRIDLRLETWGSIEVLVPVGVGVQMVGGSGRVRLDPLAPPVPGGPLLRISTSGPAGTIRIRHPVTRGGGLLTRWRRRRSEARPTPSE